MPQIVQVLRSREGLSALLEFFEGAEPIEGTRVVRVGTPTEFKDALDDAGTRPVVCMFAGAKDLGARVLLPVYHRLPAADEFDGLEFLRVEVATDDRLAQAVCEEAFVAKSCPTPTFCFYSQCSSQAVEVRGLRRGGADAKLKKLAEADANGEDLERLSRTNSTR